MKSYKKFFLAIFLVIFLFFIFVSFILAREAELEYPEIPGAEAPRSVKTFMPEYIKYLFNFAIIIAGLVAFASLVYGGFRYLTSAGNPVVMGDAKSQITAGILGLVLILGSYLLLTTINPQLVILKVGDITIAKGVILYTTDDHCNGGANPGSGLEEGTDFLRVTRSSSTLSDIRGKNYERPIDSIYFLNDNTELEVIIYRQEDYKEEAFKFDVASAGDCIDLSGPEEDIRSIELRWKIPGVYLYAEKNCQTNPQFPEPLAYIGDTADFGVFDNKAQSFKIMPWIERWRKCDTAKPGCQTPDQCLAKPKECLTLVDQKVIGKFGFVLHEKSNFEGDAEAFFGGSFLDLPPPCIDLPTEDGQGVCQNTAEPYCREHVRDRASSITIFKQREPDEESAGEGVTLYANYNFNEQEEEEEKDENRVCGPFKPNKPHWITEDTTSFDGPSEFPQDCGYVLGNRADPSQPGGKECGGDSCASSIKVDGNFIAVLFREDGRGQVFKKSDLRLAGEHIGNNEARYMLVIPVAAK
jgi:hypothetical protein